MTKASPCLTPSNFLRVKYGKKSGSFSNFGDLESALQVWLPLFFCVFLEELLKKKGRFPQKMWEKHGIAAAKKKCSGQEVNMVEGHPTINGGMQNGSLFEIFTQCMHVYESLALICMLSRCL